MTVFDWIDANTTWLEVVLGLLSVHLLAVVIALRIELSHRKRGYDQLSHFD